ncbi:MAG: cell envelope integrity EipB family protein [Pseudomonadota bacterium]
MTLAQRRSTAIVAVAGMLHLGSTTANAQAAAALKPHRAVYEITLVRSSVGAGIADLTGRMVYELTGSDCAGYTQKMRMVTRTANSEGNVSVSDLRSSYFESAADRTFRFETENFRDKQLSDSSAGSAAVDSKPGSQSERRLRIRLSAPTSKELLIDANALFPVEHSVKLLEAARRGERIFSADVYDGSEKGEKVFSTTAAIGQMLPAGANERLQAAKDSTVLNALKSWPVSLSYFERDDPRDDAGPTYELAFLFFDNGVSRRLVIDYGTFAIRGRLTTLKMLPPARCKS